MVDERTSFTSKYLKLTPALKKLIDGHYLKILVKKIQKPGIGNYIIGAGAAGTAAGAAFFLRKLLPDGD
jgi:hypothetical protein